MKVPFLDLPTPHRRLKHEILPLWEEILDSGRFTGGEHVAGFETEFAAACGVGEAVAVNSGTDALRFIFLALDAGPGDEIVTAANTFIATSEAISQTGARPVFVDVDPRSYTMDPNRLEAAITGRTKGIVPVHLYGQPAEMDAIGDVAARHGLWVVEDAAQAPLAEYRGGKTGGLGIAAAFSFYPGKNLGACGEAGAVTTNDGDIAARVRMLRDHGQGEKYRHEFEGYNGRCDALQAAALRIKLNYLADWNSSRRDHAALYNETLDSDDRIVLPYVPDHILPVWHLFVVLVEGRDAVARSLNEQGVGTAMHYPIPLHLQRAYASMEIPEGTYPVTESCARRLLSLPMYPEMSREQVLFVCDALKSALG